MGTHGLEKWLTRGHSGWNMTPAFQRNTIPILLACETSTKEEKIIEAGGSWARNEKEQNLIRKDHWGGRKNYSVGSVSQNMAIGISIPLSGKQMSRIVSQGLTFSSMCNSDTEVPIILSWTQNFRDKQEILVEKKRCWHQKQKTCRHQHHLAGDLNKPLHISGPLFLHHLCEEFG